MATEKITYCSLCPGSVCTIDSETGQRLETTAAVSRIKPGKIEDCGVLQAIPRLAELNEREQATLRRGRKIRA